MYCLRRPRIDEFTLVKPVVQQNGIRSDTWALVVPESLSGRRSSYLMPLRGRRYSIAACQVSCMMVALYFALGATAQGSTFTLNKNLYGQLVYGSDARQRRASVGSLAFPSFQILLGPRYCLCNSMAESNLIFCTDVVRPSVHTAVLAHRLMLLLFQNCCLSLEMTTTAGLTMTSSLPYLSCQRKMIARQADKRIGFFQTTHLTLAFTREGDGSPSQRGRQRTPSHPQLEV